MKRLFTAMLLIFLLTIPVYASDAMITVQIPNRGVLIEDQYYVTVSISENPSFGSIQIELFYNDDVVNCIQVKPGDVVQGMLSDTNPHAEGDRTSAILSAAGINNTDKNGTLATFVFDAPDGGDPEFSVSLVEIRDSFGHNVDCEIAVVNNYSSMTESTEIPVTSPSDNDKADELTNPPHETEDKPDYDPPDKIDKEPDYDLPHDNYDETDNNLHYDNDDEEITGDWWGTPEIVNSDSPLSSTDSHWEWDRLPYAFRDDLMKPITDFTDTDASHWANDYIREAAARGVIDGYPDGTFQPDRKMNRAEFITLLWNMVDKPESTASLPFDDVSMDDWFYPQVVWAYEIGCIDGVTPTKFQPYGTITREQAVTILHRFIGSPEAEFDLGIFADIDEISSYALPAVRWALYDEIISGVDETHLNPRSDATRAQLSTIIVRYIHYIQNIQSLNP